MIQDYIDMDTQEKIRYISESSNASTSGYSTMSPGPGGVQLGNNSPNSSVFSSPAQSPATALQTEFSNLNLPTSHSPHYTPLHASSANVTYAAHNNSYMNFGNFNNINMLPQQQQQQPQQQQMGLPMMSLHAQTHAATKNATKEYTAYLKILEHPMEKFRFRYKSEMHGTHGSLNGVNSKRTPKTFPEVELCNYKGRAVIRCSLFQNNLDSPHSHQLVVRQDDIDRCDPHDLYVSPEQGFVAQFQNMGIIHTAKKFIFDELLKKKTNRLYFDLGHKDLSTKQIQELHKQTEKEAKNMNLNQVRLCFEAFKIEDDKNWVRIAAPVFTNPINNRKSAQTGELRICRLSTAFGSVAGGEDLILLVEKVSKKNIKVRFYELCDDEEIVWEAYAKFSESDVHHQYAIICQTPPYKNKNIEKPVEVCIELVRPSDDERSFPPVTFRYKPREIITSRKRRRTANTSSGSSLSSFELPKTVEEQTAHLKMGAPTTQPMPAPHNEQQMPPITGYMNAPTISEEYNKDHELQKFLNNDLFRDTITLNSEELSKLCPQNITDMCLFEDMVFDKLETDGVASQKTTTVRQKQLSTSFDATDCKNNKHLQKIFNIFDELRSNKDKAMLKKGAEKVQQIFYEHAEKNELGDTLLHELVVNDDPKVSIKTCHILNFFKQQELFNVCNMNNETALHFACIHNKAQYIRPLLGLGCDANVQDRNGNTALHIAVQEDFDKCVDSFLNMNRVSLDLRKRNDEGLTPLHLAIRKNNYNVVKRFLEHDKYAAMQPNSKDGNTALHMAVLQQQLELVKLLIKELNVTELVVTRNAAGLTAIDLAKNMKTKSANNIWEYLSNLGFERSSPIVVKEEDLSSRSTTEEDDDDDDDESQEETISTLDIKIEHESDAEVGESAEESDNKNNGDLLKMLLKDEENCEALAKLLNTENLWRQLAKEAQIGHYTLLWRNATDMLIYIKTNADNELYKQIAFALNQIDADIWKKIKTKQTT